MNFSRLYYGYFSILVRITIRSAIVPRIRNNRVIRMLQDNISGLPSIMGDLCSRLFISLPGFNGELSVQKEISFTSVETAGVYQN